MTDLEIVTIDGLTLRCRDTGEQDLKPCLFIHGFGDSSPFWDAVISPLRGLYRILVVDLRGHGDSAWDPKAKYAMEDYLGDILYVVKFLALEQLNFVGHSLGGAIALRIAAAHPARVLRLVLIDYSPECAPEVAGIVAAVVTQGIREFVSLKEFVTFFQESRPLVPTELAQDLGRKILRQLTKNRFQVKTDPAIVTYTEQLVCDDMAWSLLTLVQCPTLVIRGSVSAVLRESVAKQMIGTMIDARLEVVAQSGHSVIIDNPYICVDAILSFFRS